MRFISPSDVDESDSESDSESSVLDDEDEDDDEDESDSDSDTGCLFFLATGEMNDYENIVSNDFCLLHTRYI